MPYLMLNGHAHELEFIGDIHQIKYDWIGEDPKCPSCDLPLSGPMARVDRRGVERVQCDECGWVSHPLAQGERQS